jgi:hypothetical protein
MAIAHANTEAFAAADTDLIYIVTYDCTGTNRVLVAKVALKSSSATVTAVTWQPGNGEQSLTFLNADRNGDARSELWYLPNPTASANGQVKFDLSASVRVAVAASTYTGVHQTTPFRTAAAASNNGTDAGPTVDVVALNTEMVVDSLCQVSAGPDTAAGDHTERHDTAATGGGTDTRGASQEKASTGDTETMGWTMSDSDNWSICAGPLQEPSVGGRTTYNTDSHPLGQHLGHSFRMPGA